LNALWTKSARMLFGARMEKPRPRSTGLLRFHGGTSDGTERVAVTIRFNASRFGYVPGRRLRPAPMSLMDLADAGVTDRQELRSRALATFDLNPSHQARMQETRPPSEGAGFLSADQC
jgi:hypothetical protein